MSMSVADVGDVGVLVQDVAVANGRGKVVGCAGASGLPRRIRHNRHARKQNHGTTVVEADYN